MKDYHKRFRERFGGLEKVIYPSAVDINKTALEAVLEFIDKEMDTLQKEHDECANALADSVEEAFKEGKAAERQALKNQKMCHWCEIKGKPQGFSILASCPIHDPQAI